MDNDHIEEPNAGSDPRAALAQLPTFEEEDGTTSAPSQTESAKTIATAVDLSPNADATVAMSPADLGLSDTFTNLEVSDLAIDAASPFDVVPKNPDEPAPGPSPEVTDATPDPLAAEPIEQGFTSYETGLATEAEKTSRGVGVAKRIAIVLAALVLAALIVYGAVGLFFTSHFMPNTTVNGEEVSSMSVEALAAHVNEIGDGYALHLLGDGIDATIASSDIDFSLNGAEYANEAHAQLDPWQWPKTIRDAHDLAVTQSITYDEGKLDALLDDIVNKANEGATQPTNATMKYDDTTKRFAIVEQAYGTAVDRAAVGSLVSQNVRTLQASAELGEQELVQPSVWSDDEQLISTVETANNILTTPVPLRIANTEATTLDPVRVATWLTMDGEGKLVADRDKIKEWAQGKLSEFFDTVGKKNTFTRPDGKKIEVEGGTYGWIVDGEALSNIVADNLEAGKTDAIDCPMKQSAAIWAPGSKEWPDRYIDVDLSEQYVRMYDENKNVIWETSCVSGNPKYGGGTSTGVSYIYDKASPMILVGNDYDHDGEPDYKTPVDYWMPFEGGQGLHDAPWRSYFGGDIYSYDGSHGCVNLPYDKARELYGLTNVGDVVIVHW